MSYKFQVVCEVIVEESDGDSVAVTQSGIHFKLDEQLAPHGYYDKGNINANGAEAMRICLIEGMNAFIQASHQKGLIDSAENLRYIISKLEDLFVRVATIETSSTKNPYI